MSHQEVSQNNKLMVVSILCMMIRDNQYQEEFSFRIFLNIFFNYNIEKKSRAMAFPTFSQFI